MSTVLNGPRPALTTLSEDETLFRDAVREFAEAELASRAMPMDQAQQMDADLLPMLFEMGLMGIEIPEHLGGAGSTFFTSVLVVEELSRV
ncbi:MAG TPA: acyl-CoA dehydrogenase family protein, partial [Longimicrobiales bacterium]|nr:acyl-CoA dehydrogenase family protein [Longimicrobiales bacterium]